MTMRSLLAWAVSGLLAGLVIGLADSGALLLGALPMFLHAREAAVSIAWTLSLSLAFGTLAGAVFGAAWDAAASLFASASLRDRPLLLSAILAGAFSPPLGWVFWQLTSGDRASRMSGRLPLVVATAILVASCIGTALVRIPPWGGKSALRKRLCLILALLIAMALHLIDLKLLVRLYPLFHQGLTGLAFATLGLGVRLWLGDLRKTKTGALVALAIAIALSLAFGSLGLRALRHSQNPAFVVGERTAHASDILALVNRVKPPKIAAEPAGPEPEFGLPEAKRGPAITRPGYNLFLITVDAMRYDRLKALGARREAAPQIDRFAERAVVFSRAYSPMPHTSYALSSLLTGKYTCPLFDVPGAPQAHETWPEIMARFRYKTAAFFTRAIFFIDRGRFEPYFRNSYGFSYRKADSRLTAAERVKQLTDYLDERGPSQNPVFAWVHFFEPHEPYDPACTRFGDTPEERYDCEIWSVDQALGPLFDYLDRSLPKSIIIVTADHGEEFDEHGGRFHGTTLYDEQARVPLLMRVPGVAHRVVAEPVSLVDLLGTSLSILDIPVPARVRSRDLGGLLIGAEQKTEAFSEAPQKAMIVSDGYKLICDTGAGLCQLYDLGADPGERRSIASLKPDIAKRLRSRLSAWRKSHARFELRPIETKQGSQGWPEAVQRGLDGDDAAVPGLLALLDDGASPPALRRKSAELVWALWSEHPAALLDGRGPDADPEVDAWLMLARRKASLPVKKGAMASIQKKLDPLSAPWRALVMERLGSGDRFACSDAMRIAKAQNVPDETRLAAVQRIGQVAAPGKLSDLIALLDDYPLTLEAALALGRLRDRRAVAPLVKRLARERFPERKAAIISALAAIGDQRAAGPIAGALLSEQPPAGALKALHRLAKSASGPLAYRLPDRSRVALYLPPMPERFTPRLSSVARIVVGSRSRTGSGRIVFFCNEKESGEMPVFPGEQESSAELTGCAAEGKELAIALTVEPEGAGTEFFGVALIGPP